MLVVIVFSLSTSVDVDRGCANVEVIILVPDLEGVELEFVGSGAATASSAVDIPSLIERVIAKLPPDLGAQAVDKKRKARSQDLGW